ncbi:MAG: YkgJ family cysteine cluster protein, partial [Lachnospiraceae bacterium]|nr:YkgJ family cysteine cluster protein [Lachnospiraceae bacterium]
MKREVDINEISDGRRYRSSDMVRIGCADCDGCSECCRKVDDTIILDPYDIYELSRGLGAGFNDLLEAGPVPAIALSVADGLILPHLNIDKSIGACRFLNSDGRCGIHSFRPGFCRLYPLGRIYENGSFSYFHQIYECPYPSKTKVRIRKWLGINDLPAYEAFVLKWHDILEETRQEAAAIT